MGSRQVVSLLVGSRLIVQVGQPAGHIPAMHKAPQMQT